MTKGWKYLEPLGTARPSEELDAETVVAACDKLNELNRGLRSRIVSALRGKRKKGFNKCADGIRNEFSASDECLFNYYFSNRAYSFDIPSQPPDPLDGRRAAVVFHMSDAPQQTLICHLRGLPEAAVMNADSSPEPDEFTRVYQFTNMRALVGAIKSVQSDVENFAFGAEDLLLGQNKPRKPADLAADLKLELEDIFSMYEKAIEQDEKSAKVLRNELNKLDLDLNVVGIDADVADVLSEKIGKIKKIAQNRDFAPIKQELAQVKQGMFSSVEAVLLSLVANDPGSVRALNAVWRSPTRKEGNGASTNAGRPWYFTQAAQSTGESRGLTSRRQGYIRDGKYIKTDAKQLRVYEVAHEFNLSSTEMIALLRNLGFQVKDHMSVYTPVMAEAVEKELDAEHWAAKKNTEAQIVDALTRIKNRAERRAAKKNTEAASQARQLININQATAKELKRLPGVSPKIAKRIVRYRKQNGLFQRIDDLVKIQGISLNMLNDLRFMISAPN